MSNKKAIGKGIFGQIISAKPDYASDSAYAFKAIRIDKDHIPVI